MISSYTKKLATIGVLISTAVVLSSFGISRQDKKEQDEPPKNLKVLPKNTTSENVKKLMKTFTKSLGVKCDECHVGKPQEGKPFPKFDFPSDEKPEKNIARKMMVMVDSINSAFISKMGESDFEQVTCVTCHRGSLTPMVSVDSLPKKQ
jgi:cytochrome c peroxidase